MEGASADADEGAVATLLRRLRRVDGARSRSTVLARASSTHERRRSVIDCSAHDLETILPPTRLWHEPVIDDSARDASAGAGGRGSESCGSW